MRRKNVKSLVNVQLTVKSGEPAALGLPELQWFIVGLDPKYENAKEWSKNPRGETYL